MRQFFALSAALLALPAYADHPGDRLDEVMSEKEPAFEAVDLRDLPAMDLLGPEGASLGLTDLEDQVVVLSFVPADCGSPCADQQALLAKVRDGVNASPMLSMVTFLIVSDAENPVPQPLAENVTIARPKATIEALIERYRALTTVSPDAPLVHVIARGNRHAGIFAGDQFRHINMILYVNGLTNEH